MENKRSKMQKYFYIWLLPIIWATFSMISYRHPGDEYALYFFSSIAGTWLAFFIDVGDVHNLSWLHIIFAMVGAIVVAVVGILLDKLRVNRLLWVIMFILVSSGLLAYSICSYPSVQRALDKNGSWMAYISSSINMGLYLSIVLSIIINTFGRLLKFVSSKNIFQFLWNQP